jgi:hypothetical protein
MIRKSRQLVARLNKNSIFLKRPNKRRMTVHEMMRGSFWSLRILRYFTFLILSLCDPPVSATKKKIYFYEKYI